MTLILLSVGHHPQAKGASSGDFNEHDEAKIWVQRLHEILGEDISMIVPPMTLPYKVQFINSQPATIAIEIHFNSFKKWIDLDKDGVVDANEMIAMGKGSETLYFPSSQRGKKHALIMQEALSAVFKPDRGVKEGWYQMNPKKGVDYFLNKTKCPALIIEPDFIHRKSVIIKNREDGCKAIANALRKIIKEL